MRILKSLLIVGVITFGSLRASAQDTPLARSRAAFASADLPGTELAAREVLQSDTAADHRREAHLRLANLAWRIHGDFAAANTHFREALSVALPFRRSAIFEQRVRCDVAFGNLASAQADADSARAAAVSDAGRLQAVRARAEQALAHVAAGKAAPNLAQLVADLAAAVRAAPGDAAAARQLIEAATFAHDGPAMLAGWHSYYLLFTNGGTTNVLAGPRDVLARVLPGWSASTDDRTTRRAIAHALADSRLFESAAWLAAERMHDGSTLASADPRSRDIVVWARFISDARRVTDEFYRRTALRTQDPSAWHDSVETVARTAWQALSWSAAPPPFSLDQFYVEAGKRFGLITAGWGVTGGFDDIHIGHSVSDERHRVTQYGQTAAFRFVQLDAMISNGYLTWFWDGLSGDGGWQNAEMVVQVRAAYTAIPLADWGYRSDSAQRRLVDERIAADSASDLARARTTPVAYFPSTLFRLTRRGEQTLVDSLVRTGLAGTALQAAFVRILSDETQAYSIFQHEGRHAIDNGLGASASCGPNCTQRPSALSSAELEFDAKLSQVAFAPRPELALTGIITASIGDETPHGVADARIMRGLLAWMGDHAGEIVGLDRSAPLLPQLPLLTGPQLREAFKSMDPLAAGVARRKP